MTSVRLLGCLWLVILVVSCKSQQRIIPITDELVDIELGKLGDLDDREEEETEEEEEYVMVIAPITDEDVKKELGELRGSSSPPMRKATPPVAVDVPGDEPINAALLLDSGHVVLSDSDSSIMLDEVEVVGIVRSVLVPLEALSPSQIKALKSEGVHSNPLVREVKVRSYSPITIEDKMFFSKELKVKAIEVSDPRLYAYIKEELGRPYEKDRVDHLTLMQNLYKEVYDIEFPRTTSKAVLANYTDGSIHYTRDMEEGDLLFFRFGEGRKPYTHVGVYLKNKRFITVTPSGGVEIVNLRDRKWRNTYMGRGRVKNTRH